MIDENPYRLEVKKWRKQSSRKHVRLEHGMYLDEDTGELTNVCLEEVTKTFRDVTDFVKLYDPGVFVGMKPYEVKVFVWIIEHMKYGNVCVFDYAGCMKRYGMGRSTVFRGMKELLRKDIIRERRKCEYWINPNVVYKGNREVREEEL